jgi:hypothetical protein
VAGGCKSRAVAQTRPSAALFGPSPDGLALDAEVLQQCLSPDEAGVGLAKLVVHHCSSRKGTEGGGCQDIVTRPESCTRAVQGVKEALWEWSRARSTLAVLIRGCSGFQAAPADGTPTHVR